MERDSSSFRRHQSNLGHRPSMQDVGDIGSNGSDDGNLFDRSQSKTADVFTGYMDEEKA